MIACFARAERVVALYFSVRSALVVTRKDIEKPDGGLQTAYELIAGERRLRAIRKAMEGRDEAIINADVAAAPLKIVTQLFNYPQTRLAEIYAGLVAAGVGA